MGQSVVLDDRNLLVNGNRYTICCKDVKHDLKSCSKDHHSLVNFVFGFLADLNLFDFVSKSCTFSQRKNQIIDWFPIHAVRYAEAVVHTFHHALLVSQADLRCHHKFHGLVRCYTTLPFCFHRNGTSRLHFVFSAFRVRFV